jgi:ABC-type nitrate/sulfonate/bicarbonate transport system substrate-binding protein
MSRVGHKRAERSKIDAAHSSSANASTDSDSGALVGGYVGLVDAAPFLVGEHQGFFEKEDLRVEMQREMGWATVRDRLISGELDFAHAPAGLVVAITSGEGCLSTPCVALIEVNRHGNGITLSREAGLQWSRGNLLGWIEEMGRKLVIAVPSWVSSHAWLATRWLRGVGIEVSKLVQLVVVPPMQMVANLSAGHLDGFCVGEPWNSMAVRQKKGWVTALSSEIAPGHSEKVLMVTRERLESEPDRFGRLSKALSEACRYCEAAGNREKVARVVADAFGARFDEEVIRRSLIGPFDDGRSERKADRLHWFTGSWVDLESERLTAEVELQCRSWSAMQGTPMARRFQTLERCFSPGLRSQTQFT